jgi:NADH dehydrogenase [ubiquinone] 1 alpha subcomplex assembly factor 6
VTELSYCAEQVRRFDYDRFICTLFAPPEEREGLAAVYAFNSEVARIRESVRQPLLGHIRLQWWTDTLDAIFAGRPPRHEVALALSSAVQRFDLGRRHFDRLIETRAFDMDDKAPADVAALIGYAEGTAATVGLVSLDVLGAEGDAARAAARDVGIAWALTGVLRAVPFHASQRRVYLPASLNREAGLDVFQLFEMRSPEPLRSVVAAVAECARSRLDAARAARRDIPRQALPALLPATLADGYLRRLQRAAFDPFAAAAIQKPGPLRLAKVALNAARGRY